MVESVVSWLASRDVGSGDVVMFDIDDTLISANTRQPIQSIVQLLHTSKILGYKIIIITSRHPSSREYTNLQLGGFGIFPDALEFCPAREKTRLKKVLSIIHNYTFVLSVGDLPTDLGGSMRSLQVN